MTKENYISFNEFYKRATDPATQLDKRDKAVIVDEIKKIQEKFKKKAKGG